MHLASIILGYSIFAIINSRLNAEGELFKINKLNLIWDKAQHSLGSTKLKNLKNDLIKHESDEINWKKLNAHNQDKDGIVAASVRKKLLSIMKKYALEHYYDDIHTLTSKEKREPDPRVDKSSHPPELPTFRNSKLDKLWKKAEKAGFTQEQLMVLHEEFEHEQDKLDEHYQAANSFVDGIQKSETNRQNSIEETVVDDGKRKFKTKPFESPAEKKARLDTNAKQSLKEKHSERKQGYNELHLKVASGAIEATGPFRESRVNELWSMASQSNFTNDELLSLKEELDHYQVRIEKLNHFRNQLERNKLTSTEDNDDDLKHIHRKVSELNQRVEKYEKSILAKIVKDEL